ncbi:MAG TPA: MFS transporter [Actinoplanes sp.]|nr:MFS transporter [Actinoplanes sp.]
MRGWLRQTAGGLPRQFWFLWAGTLINRVGSFVVLFLSIYLTSDRGFSQSQAGLILGVYGVGGAIGTMTGGVLSDRWGRRPTLLIAQFGASALMLGLGLAHTYPQILIAAFALGLFAEGARPAFGAMMIDVVPEVDRVRAFSLNYWAINLGFALAAVCAGLAAQVDYLILFVVDSASTLITAVISLVFLAETKPASPSGAIAAVAPTGRGIGSAWRDRVFLTFVGLNFLTVLVIFQHGSTLSLSMIADGFSAAEYGTVIAVNGVLIVCGQLFVPRLIQGRDSARVLAVGALLVGAGFGLVGVAGSALALAGTVVIWTLGEMLQSPSNAATIAALAPTALRGRYQGLNSLSWQAGSALAPICGGLALQTTGDVVLWASCFGICVLVAVGQVLAGPARVRRAAQLREQELAEAR